MLNPKDLEELEQGDVELSEEFENGLGEDEEEEGAE